MTQITSGKTLTAASKQWATRPADQRFESLQALLQATQQYKMQSVIAETRIDQLSVIADSSDDLLVVGPTGNRATLTNWSAGQLSQRAGAPKDYISKLPAPLAAQCLQYGLQTRSDSKPSVLLFGRMDDGIELRAITSDVYQRVWNCEIAQALVDLQDRCPNWEFPTPFKRAGGTTVQNAWGDSSRAVPTAYASDRDMFVFLCDYTRSVEVNGNALARGFFMENSEVGDASVKLTCFLFDFVCSNLLVWGAQNVQEISLRHIGQQLRSKVLDPHGEVIPTLTRYAESKASEQESQIQAAQKRLIANSREDVISKLFAMRMPALSKGVIETAYEVVEQTPRYGSPNSVWGIVNGLTEVSQRASYTDARIQIDRAAGKILRMAF